MTLATYNILTVIIRDGDYRPGLSGEIHSWRDLYDLNHEDLFYGRLHDAVVYDVKSSTRSHLPDLKCHCSRHCSEILNV